MLVPLFNVLTVFLFFLVNVLGFILFATDISYVLHGQFWEMVIEPMDKLALTMTSDKASDQMQHIS